MKLLIEVSNEHGSLGERLATIKNNLELLYEQTVLREGSGENAD